MHITYPCSQLEWRETRASQASARTPFSSCSSNVLPRSEIGRRTATIIALETVLSILLLEFIRATTLRLRLRWSMVYGKKLAEMALEWSLEGFRVSGCHSQVLFMRRKIESMYLIRVPEVSNRPPKACGLPIRHAIDNIKRIIYKRQNAAGMIAAVPEMHETHASENAGTTLHNTGHKSNPHLGLQSRDMWPECER